MKRFIIGFIIGVSPAIFFNACEGEPEEVAEVPCTEKMSCSAAKVAASKVCDCQIVCYEDGK